MMAYNNYMGAGGIGAGIFGAWMGMFLIPLMVWSVAWKGYALWKAAKADSKIWFVVLMLVNTVGILDILYIYVFSKGALNGTKTSKSVSKKSSRK